MTIKTTQYAEMLARLQRNQGRSKADEKTVPSSGYSPAVVRAWFLESGLPEPEFEFQNYIPGRKFRLDIAWPQFKIGIEVQGGIWIKAAHSTASGIKRDMEKRNLGLCAGWRVLECEPKDLCTVETVEQVHKLWRIQLESENDKEIVV